MKTKKLLIASVLFVGVASITSCKKSYSCECSTIGKYNGLTMVDTKTTNTLSEKMKDKQALASCKSTETQMNDVNKKYDDLMSDPSAGDIYKSETKCTLK